MTPFFRPLPKPDRALRPQCGTRAFALVTVLIVLSMLVVVAVGYLSSMASERATANAFAAKAKAEQAAQAGADSAMAILREAFKSFPDSATAWDQNLYANESGINTPGTMLYMRAVPSSSNSEAPDLAPSPVPDPLAEAGVTPEPPPVDANGPSNFDKSNGLDKRKTFVLPLVSGATPRLLPNKGNKSIKPINKPDDKPNTDPLAASNDVSTDLNARRFQGDTQGWLGSPAIVPPPKTAPTPVPVRVPWVEIKQQPDLKGSTASLADPENQPVIARYAFWVEDESFKANVNFAGLGDAANLHQRSDNNANIELSAKNLDLLGSLRILAGPDPAHDAKSIFDVRSIFPGQIFPEPRAFGHGSNLGSSQELTPPSYPDIEDPVSHYTAEQKKAKSLARYRDQIAFLTTTQSSALNLSRYGSQRLNLNTAIDPATDPSNTTVVQRQVDKIVQTIRRHVPNFGQRFYRTVWTGNPPLISPDNLNKSTLVTKDNAKIYLYKTAANIRDYIDKDCLPTIILAGGKVSPNNKETKPINFDDGPNPLWAIGKDSAPFMQECGVRFSGAVSGARYTVNVDYYVEFWNMSTRTIKSTDLGPSPYILVKNPTKWWADNKSNPNGTQVRVPTDSGASLTDTRAKPPGRDFEIDISKDQNGNAIVFPPGAVTVLTTDPSYGTILASISDGETGPIHTQNQAEAANHFAVVKFVEPGKRVYTGSMPTGCNELRMQYESTASSDYETELVIGNSNGYIDSLAGGLSMTGGIISFPAGSTPLRPVYGGYLRGNLASSGGTGLQPSTIGDPRTNNEQLIFTINPPSNTVDQSRYKNFDLSAAGGNIPPTFGLPNIYSISPTKAVNPWPDYYWFPGNDTAHPAPAVPGSMVAGVMKAANSPGVIADDKLVSIGQLGDIFDSARLPSGQTSEGAGATLILASHGGGRTLRIGHHDDLNDGLMQLNNANETGATPSYVNSPSSTWASWRLADCFSVSDEIQLPGRININGLARDNGAALRAALEGFKFQPKTKDSADPTQYDRMMHGDATLDGKALDAAGLNNLIKDIVDNRLTYDPAKPTRPGPFFERGEISEAPILNANSTPPPPELVAGVSTAKVFDRGREELVRRLLEMTTTRGNVFTVYAIGQSISQSTPTAVKRITGTYQLKITFRLVPKATDSKTGLVTDFHPATDISGKLNDFDPSKVEEVTARFAKPDHYDIEVLSTSSGRG